MTASHTEATGFRKLITLGEQRTSDDEARQVFGDGMYGRLFRVKQGDLSAERLTFNLHEQT
jgi:hypothetical protein